MKIVTMHIEYINMKYYNYFKVHYNILGEERTDTGIEIKLYLPSEYIDKYERFIVH